jgi:hypothetical protein
MLIKPEEPVYGTFTPYSERGSSERSVTVANKRWSELSTGQRRGIVFSGVVQVALLIAALVDIWRRSEEEIRGDKRLWTAAAFVNFIGPVSYFLFGRR